jgi:hypothetical protein
MIRYREVRSFFRMVWEKDGKRQSTILASALLDDAQAEAAEVSSANGIESFRLELDIESWPVQQWMH